MGEAERGQKYQKMGDFIYGRPFGEITEKEH